MRAAFLIKNGKASEAFEIREVEKPEVKKGQVLIKGETFGLNFAEVMARQGLYREAPPLPFIPGYDMVGRVEVVGEGVDKSWIGKRVAALSRFGTYAEYVSTYTQGITEIPEDMDAGEATALCVQYTTAYYSACILNNLMPGDRVLIHAAAGGVGTALIQLCLWKGCKILGTAGSDEKLDKLRKAGVHHPINYRKGDYFEEAKKILGDKRIDVTFNPIAGTTFKKDLKLLGSGGRLVLFGAAELSGNKPGKLTTLSFLWKMGLIMPLLLMAKSRSIIGVNVLKVGDHKPELLQHCMRELIQLWKDGVIKPHVGQEFSINELAAAHEMLEMRKSTGKLVVRW